MSMQLRTLLIVVLMTLVLFGMIGRKQWTLSTGTPVVLETQPVDPRSLFRGDYVHLRYAINRLDMAKHPALAGVKRGDLIYVSIVPGKPYWQLSEVSTQPPQGGVFLKGRVDRVVRRFDSRLGKLEQGYNVWISYGIENYFVPEGEGREIERPAAGAKVSIEVAVDRFGSAGIRVVLVNGEPRYIESLF